MIRWVFLPIGLAVLLSVALLFAVTDSKPDLSRTVHVGLDDLDRGKAIVNSLGLRRMKEGEVRQLLLTEADLDKGVSYLAHRLAGGSASVKIALAELIVQASLPLPVIRRFVNLELVLVPGNGVLRPAKLHLGKLALPARSTGKLLLWGLAGSPYGAELAAARALLDSAQLTGQTLALRFVWRGAAVHQMLAGGRVKGIDESTLQVYRERIRAVRSSDFPILLGEVFTLAQARSRNNDPVAENRAALTSLAEKALGSRLLTQHGIARINRQTGVKLAGRSDFAQHFALSAFLAATGGARFSNMAGLYKELKDAQIGSGFSFNDLAADRAGSRLGAACTESPAAALRMQKRLAGARNGSAFFPQIRDLPEFMSQAEFQRKFGGVDQPAFQRMIQQIEARIDGLSIYKD